ncbi:hypothetical protein CLHUN_02470 [Ruminiclostridium hungatei]|uniref:Uncharacterized protein n=1 Tax=Ruminiclostridium hungatei TaxID=48256 RepID=A0A1V4ST04_RUMHU|nr:hypothetical protein [Ruminiclostridium hungatei]OPX46431.1 hypothetical protein CLHUN_02470 [Ruminiclostridium hungatei]
MIRQMEVINRYPYGVPTATSFIKVTGEDGVFYDIVRSFDSQKHRGMLQDEGYEAEVVPPKVVPSCTMRDFTNGLGSYMPVVFRDGGDFYHKP